LPAESRAVLHGPPRRASLGDRPPEQRDRVPVALLVPLLLAQLEETMWTSTRIEESAMCGLTNRA